MVNVKLVTVVTAGENDKIICMQKNPVAIVLYESW
jgi:hypothetical protein